MNVEPISTLNVDGQTYTVTDLPENLRRLVSLLDSMRQEESDLNDELVTVRYAQRALTQDLSNGLQTMLAEQAAATADAAPSVPADAAPANGTN